MGVGEPPGVENTEVIDSAMCSMSTNRRFAGFSVQDRPHQSPALEPDGRASAKTDIDHLVGVAVGGMQERAGFGDEDEVGDRFPLGNGWLIVHHVAKHPNSAIAEPAGEAGPTNGRQTSRLVARSRDELVEIGPQSQAVDDNHTQERHGHARNDTGSV